MDLIFLERELKKRHDYPYRWYRKQNDLWDGRTNFIYETINWETLIDKIKKVYLKYNLNKHEIFQYAANRWYNFHSARAVEFLFCNSDKVVPAKSKDHEKDFFIDKIPFDHKTSVFPEKFGYSYDWAVENEHKLIRWLYDNQSSQKRFHLKNRLFVIVYDSEGNHWKMKAELQLIKHAVENYLQNFETSQLHSITFDGNQIASDIIWIQRP